MLANGYKVSLECHPERPPPPPLPLDLSEDGLGLRDLAETDEQLPHREGQSKLGTHKTVTARLRPLLEPFLGESI